MSDMNPYLAAMYNTNGAAETMTEDMQKNANAELFCKLAADNGLDLSQMTDDQIASVYAQVFPEDIAKMAEDEKKKEHEEGESEEKEEKEEKAAEYVAQKQAFVEKCAEADYMGRIMAHAFTQERENIKTAGDDDPTTAMRARRGGSSTVNTAMWEQGKKDFARKADEARNAAQNAKAYEGPARGAGQGYSGGKQVGKASELAEKGKRFLGTRKGKLIAGGAGAALAAGGALAAYKGLKGKKKEGSAEAFEEISANHAIKVAAAAGYDVDEAVERVSAVYTLGLDESEKIAHVNDVEGATHVRGLEYLEAAGYPVNWEEVFGS